MSNLQADGLHSQLSELGGSADTFGTTELVYFSSYSNYQDWHTENWFTKMNTPSTHSCVVGHRYQTFCVKGTVQKHVGSLAFNGHSLDNMTQTGRTDAPHFCLSVTKMNYFSHFYTIEQGNEWNLIFPTVQYVYVPHLLIIYILDLQIANHHSQKSFEKIFIKEELYSWNCYMHKYYF